MEWLGFIAWLGAIGAGLWILHSVMRRVDWSNPVHRVTSAGLLLFLVGASIRLAVLPPDHMTDVSALLLMVTPLFIIGIAASLIHIGLGGMRAYNRPALLLGGFLLFLSIAVVSNIAVAACTYSDNAWGYVWLFFEIAIVAIILMMLGVWYVLTLPGKRKAGALLFIVVFPVGLIFGLMLRPFLTPACVTWWIG